MFRYTVRSNSRSRRMRLSVARDGSVTVSAPKHIALSVVEGFVARHAEWVLHKIEMFRRLPPRDPVARYGRREYLLNKEKARDLVLSRLAYFSPLLGVTYGRVAIRDQKTCWGSCSRTGNLNFNYKLLFLSPALRDYVIVHELAHRIELNHSRRFWEVVGGVFPEWHSLRRELREKKILR